MGDTTTPIPTSGESEDLTDQNKIELIYNENEKNTLGFRIKAFFNQLFRGKKNSNSEIELMVRGELDDLKADYDFSELPSKDIYKKTFENFHTIELKNGKDISSLTDINKLGHALTSDSKKDRSKENGFYRLISGPLHQLDKLEKDSEEYISKRDELIDNVKTYLDSHNPHSKIGKARCEFAVRLGFLLNEEKDLYEESLEEEMDEDIEDEIENEKEDKKENSREKTSFKNLVDSKDVGLTNVASKSASKADLEL